MNKIRVYNDNEIKILLNNSNVERIKNKSQIVYKNDFKLWAIKEKLSNKDKTAREIFVAGGFDMNILDERTPQRRLSSWIKKYQKFGEDYFMNKNKYSYKALEVENKINNFDINFINYLYEKINDPKYVAIIINKDKFGKINIINLVGKENEKINN